MSTKPEIAVRSSHSSADGSQRWLIATSCLLWLVVAAAPSTGGLDDDDGWEAAYAVYSVALTMAAAVVGYTVVRWGQPATRVRSWSLGVVVLVAAVLSTVVAWASVLWQAMLAVAFVLLAMATHRARTPLLALAGAQLAGLAAFLVGNAAGIGDVDSYGDRPLAGDVSVALGALLTATTAWLLVKSVGAQSDR
jgi:hypothetical protein